MTSLYTRFVCAMLSTVGAAGLVVFADPANAVGSLSAKPHTTLIAAARPLVAANNG